MMVHRDPLRAAEKLRQRIVAASARGPQVVMVLRCGSVDCFTRNSARHRALETRPELLRRVVGVFDASVSAEQLAAELREVQG